jgi:hypothetical protein
MKHLPVSHASSRARTASAPAAMLLSALAAFLAGCAQTGSGTTAREGPADPRQAVIRGTTEGITLFPARGSPSAGGSAPSSAAPAGGSTPSSAAPAGGAASSPAARGGLASLLKGLPPPTGVPLTEQKKLNDPDQGIPLPTAGSRGSPGR